MIDELIERLVKDKIKGLALTDKLTGYLVHKKKRGTFQALNESKEFEKEVTEKVIQFTKEWLTNEALDGFIKKELDKEVRSQVELELSSKGFDKVL